MRLPNVSPRRYRQVTLAALGALAAIVVSGAGVRLTESGLGCPTWPNCEPDSLTPRSAADVHAMVEFVNRTVTGLVSVAVAVVVLASLRRTPRRRDLTAWSLSLVAGVAGQIVLGGLTVLFELSPPFVMAHFLVSMVLLFCALVLHHRAGEPDGGVARPAVTPLLRSMSLVVLGLSSAVLFTGTVVTGSGPHGGDADVDRLGFLVADVARVHSLTAWVLLAAAVYSVWRGRTGDAGPVAQRWLGVLSVVVLAQGWLGYTQYALGVPEGLVALHVMGSIAVWAAAVKVWLCTVTVDAVDPDAAAIDHQVGAVTVS